MKGLFIMKVMRSFNRFLGEKSSGHMCVFDKSRPKKWAKEEAISKVWGQWAKEEAAVGTEPGNGKRT